MRAIALVLVTALAAILAASAPAAGNSPSTSVYQSKPSQVQSALAASSRHTATTSAAKPSTGASLPFTGLDIAFVLGAGVVLAGTGYSARRVTRKPRAG